MRFTSLIVSTLVVLLAGVAILLTTSATLAHAQGAPAETRIDARATEGTDPRPQPRPILDTLRTRAQEVRERSQERREDAREVRTEVQGERRDTQNTQTDAVELRRDTRADVREAQTPQERRSILREQLQERREVRERSDNLGERVSEQAKARVRSFVARMNNRFDMAIERLGQILDRINSRLTELSESGVDTTAADDASADAEAAIARAANEVADIGVLIEGALASSTPRAFVGDLRDAAREAMESIRDTHSALRAAIFELKALTAPVSSEADDATEAGADADESAADDGDDASENGQDGEDGADESAEDGDDGENAVQ